MGERVPLARYVLYVLRNQKTGYPTFRRYMRLAGNILAIEISRDLEWVEEEVETPLAAKAREYRLAKQPLLVGILGASIPLLEGFLDIYGESPIGLFAARRRETGEGVEIDVFYTRLPRTIDQPVVLVDPMLATGLTMLKAVEEVEERGARRIIIASVIASREGVERIEKAYPRVPIYSLALDPMLDDRFFIVPGLGDAGDRSLGVAP
ncbi:MAG: uracil phosphoribosyltransferase [Desulfurococcales archaeon]|nr:uracil phosphoribosyltransferase [Desulfurococcales archaeon]